MFNIGNSSLTALSAGFFVIAFIMLLTPPANRLGLLDIPDDRKRHSSAIPLVGGLAIYVILLTATFFLSLPPKIIWLVITSGIIVILGVLDDVLNLQIKFRLFSQVCATAIMIAGSSLWIQSIGLYETGLLATMTPMLGIPLTIFAVVGLTNSFNMIDGIDGLSSGLAITGLIMMGTSLGIVSESVPKLEWLLLLFSSVVAFWIVNLTIIPVKKVFLGDAGSMLLGFLISWTLIYYSQEPINLLNPVAALWCVAVPMFDTISVIIHRLMLQRSPFKADRLHLHYILIDTGFSQRTVLTLFMCLSVTMGGVGIWIAYNISSFVSLIFFLVLNVIFTFTSIKLFLAKEYKFP